LKRPDSGAQAGAADRNPNVVGLTLGRQNDVAKSSSKKCEIPLAEHSVNG
jgi:hypothetical protein